METPSSKLRFGSSDRPIGKESKILGAGAIEQMGRVTELREKEIKSIYDFAKRRSPEKSTQNAPWRQRIQAAKEKATAQETTKNPLFTGSRRNAVEKSKAMRYVGQEINTNSIIKNRLGASNSQKVRNLADVITGKEPYMRANDVRKDIKAIDDGHPEKTSFYPGMLPGQQHAMRWDRKLQKAMSKSLKGMKEW
jgi:hypothetical protein